MIKLRMIEVLKSEDLSLYLYCVLINIQPNNKPQ